MPNQSVQLYRRRSGFIIRLLRVVLAPIHPYRSIAAYVLGLALVVALPLGLGTSLLFARQADDIALTERKGVGLEATVRLDTLLFRLRDLRRGTVRRGRAPLDARLSVESSFTRLRDYMVGPGRDLGLGESLNRLASILHGIPDRTQALRQVDRTISATLDFMRYVEESSTLRSDLGDRSTALVDALAVQFAIIGDRTDQAQNLLIAAYRSRRNLGGAALGVEIFSAQADRAYATVRRDLTAIGTERHSVADAEGVRRIREIGRRLDQFRTRARSAATGSLRGRRDARPFLAAGSALAAALDVGVSVLAREIREDFAERLERQQAFATRLRVGSFAAVTAFLILAYLLVSDMARSRRRRRDFLRREAARLEAESEHRRARELLALTEARFEAVFDRTSVGIAIVDRDGAVVRANEPLNRIVPMPDGRIVGYGEPSFSRLVIGEVDAYAIEVVHGVEPDVRWTESDVSSIRGEGGDFLFAIAIVKDVTERRKSAAALLRESQFDGLVGLPNRTHFVERLRRTLAEGGDDFGAVAFVVLDEFGAILDSLGHALGDRVLVETTHRIRACIVRVDVAARIGHSDFAIAFRRREGIADELERLVRDLERPFVIDDREVVVRPRVGIVALDRAYASVDEIFADVESALQAAKSGGGRRVATFDPTMRDRALRRLDVLTNLRRAIERDQLHLCFQPIVDLDSHEISAFEVLLRWEHPELGGVSPTEFIPIAEEVGLIRPIGRWVFDRGCAQLSAWRRERSLRDVEYFSINVSAREIDQIEYADFIETTLARYGLHGRDVVVEITEGVILSNEGETVRTLERLRALGIRISIDDFGTGFSSLRYLQAFKFDFLKIDQSFVRGYPDGLASEEIVAMVVALGSSLGVTVVAEGVETASQAARLFELGTQKGQGFLFGRPLAASSARGALTSRRGIRRGSTSPVVSIR